MRDGVERPQDWHRRFVCIFRPPLQCLSSNAVAAAVKMRHRGPWSSTASVSPTLKFYGSGRLLASVFPHRRRSKAKFELQLAEQFGFIDFAGGGREVDFHRPWTLWDGPSWRSTPISGRDSSAREEAGQKASHAAVKAIDPRRRQKKPQRRSAAQRTKKWSATTARRSSAAAPTEVQ